MKKVVKIFQVQGKGFPHYVKASSNKSAIRIAMNVYPLEDIDSAYDFTDRFSDEEKQNLPSYVLH